MAKICETRIGDSRVGLLSERFVVVKRQVLLFCDLPAMSNYGGKTGIERAIEDMIEMSKKYGGTPVISDINDQAVVLDSSITVQKGLKLYKAAAKSPEEAFRNFLELKYGFKSGFVGKERQRRTAKQAGTGKE